MTADEQLVGCGNWEPKHGIGLYCANCGFHESEHRDRSEIAMSEAKSSNHSNDWLEQLKAAASDLDDPDSRNITKTIQEIERLTRELEQQRQRTKEEYEGWRDKREREQLRRRVNDG